MMMTLTLEQLLELEIKSLESELPYSTLWAYGWRAAARAARLA